MKHIFNKRLGTNLLAALLVLLGMCPATPYRDIWLNIGLFALSGAITNWMAIYMLFERVPFLYGSGVIPLRFEDFKRGIRDLIMNQFFTEENIGRFIGESANSPGISEAIDNVNLEPAFDALVDAIESSSFGPMLAMTGGRKTLDPLKGPVTAKLKAYLKTLTNKAPGSGNNTALKAKIQEVVEARLQELTPQMVKEIIEDMIREHLGWLVVWGGVFGGLMGLAMGVINLTT